MNWARLTAIVLPLLTGQALALPDDAEQDLLLEAETLVYDELKGTLTYSGAVTMQQGSLKINADEVIIYGNIDRATRVRATGQPARFEQTPNIDTMPVTANAHELDYDVHLKTLVLNGDAKLTQEGSSLSGNRIEYDVINAVVKAGSNEKNRVKMVIPPKALKPDAQNAEQDQ